MGKSGDELYQTTNPIYITWHQTPCGTILLGDLDGALCLCDWPGEPRRSRIDRRIQKAFNARYVERITPLLRQAIKQLDAYFARERTTFDLPLRFAGTDFQRSVWHALLEIPYGATISYEELAQRLGNPRAVRAVASANGANPIAIFVPCHRVIGKDHRLTGYAGGLAAKAILLDLEKEQGLPQAGSGAH